MNKLKDWFSNGAIDKKWEFMTKWCLSPLFALMLAFVFTMVTLNLASIHFTGEGILQTGEEVWFVVWAIFPLWYFFMRGQERRDNRYRDAAMGLLEGMKEAFDTHGERELMVLATLHVLQDDPEFKDKVQRKLEEIKQKD